MNSQYYYTYAPLSQSNVAGGPAGWSHLNNNSLSNFLTSYLVSNGSIPWTVDISPNISASVVNGVNGVFSFDTSGEGKNFPYPYNQGTTVYWASKYTGYFLATQTGTYTFGLSSDDDSRLWINNVDAAVVSSGTGGQGENPPVTGTVNLVAGQYYPITVGYDEGNGGYGLQVSYAAARTAAPRPWCPCRCYPRGPRSTATPST